MSTRLNNKARSKGLGFVVGRATHETNRAPRATGAADPVRIPRPKVGERLAQRGIFQAESVRIFAQSAKFRERGAIVLQSVLKCAIINSENGKQVKDKTR